MNYKNWLNLKMVQEDSGSYYINVNINEDELINEIKNNMSIADIFDINEIVDKALELISYDRLIEALREYDEYFWTRILKEVIPVGLIENYVKQSEYINKVK